MATEKQIAANAANATQGGVKTPEGTALTRLNARKHGIFAAALTRYDEEELHGIYGRLADHIMPVGPVEDMLVEKLALTYLRLQRCARAEAECHIFTWEPVADDLAVERQAMRERLKLHVSSFSFCHFEGSATTLARYDTSLTNQMIRLLHEIERLQRLRLGEHVPPPVAADVAVHLPPGTTDSVALKPAAPSAPATEPVRRLEERGPAPSQPRAAWPRRR